MSIESVMPSNHLIMCHPLLLPSTFPSIRVFFNESALYIRQSNLLELQLQHQFFQCIVKVDFFQDGLGSLKQTQISTTLSEICKRVENIGTQHYPKIKEIDKQTQGGMAYWSNKFFPDLLYGLQMEKSSFCWGGLDGKIDQQTWRMCSQKQKEGDRDLMTPQNQFPAPSAKLFILVCLLFD